MAVIQQFLNFGILNRFFIPVQATGGTVIDSDGYRIHVFTGTGPFNVSSVGTYGIVEYLVIAGGGGSGSSPGNSYRPGGGGGGGLRTGINFPVTVQDYTITVGGGGASAFGGNDSIFSSITSSGGGYGGSRFVPPGFGSGGNGGSGGGGCGDPSGGAAGGLGNRLTGTTTPAPNQGNPGGVGILREEGGGGGGAGAAGQPGSRSNPLRSVGGDGLPISWVPASYGTPGPAPGQWFAGGGGGFVPGVYPVDGAGVGGFGASNTGGGAGGFPSGLSGKSGIVIIRYPL